MYVVINFNGDDYVKAQMLDVRNDCVGAIQELTMRGRPLAEHEIQDMRDYTETLHNATQILKYFCSPEEFTALTT